MNTKQKLSSKQSAEMAQNPLLGEDGHIMVKIQKKNPKKNAPVHELKTIQDIFNVVNEKNLNKFIREFKQGLQVGIAIRELSKTHAKAEGVEIGNEVLQMPSFTWIED